MINYADDCALYREELELGSRATAFSENFRLHLRNCSRCQQDLKLVDQMDDVITLGIRNIEIPIDLKERIAYRLVNPQGKPTRVKLQPLNLRPKP